MRLKIHSHTRYDYEKPASFSPHIIRLFPRQDVSQSLKRSRFTTDESAVVQHRRDIFDNQVARCFLPKKGKTLKFDVRLDIELTERSAFDFLLDNHVINFPFAYTARERAILAPYLHQSAEEWVVAGDIWNVKPGQSTVEALISLNEALNSKIQYERREEGEAWLPAETVRVRRGSCRDFSRLAASLLRSAGVAVRMVSGYVCEFGKPEEAKRAVGSLHAWIEAYLPGAGWLGMDPTNGVLTDHHFIASAVGLHPEDISPVAGSYYGRERIPAQMTTTLSLEPLYK
ncbi:MAG TPA: transglutaminase family protein [Chthoniobacterales bacterium]